MDYRIIGTTVPAVEIDLNAGESLFSQKGGMVWQKPGIKMETNTNGGIMKGIGRMFSGETFFMNTFTAEKNSTIAFGATAPGSIVPVDVSQKGIIIQKGAFLCAQSSVQTKVTLTKRIGAGLFGGEGFILQDISGTGMVFLEVDGDKVEKELAPGEEILVDTGNVVAFDKSCSYEVTMVSGLKNVFFGGEGLFLTKLVGPGRVILQTQNFNDFAGRIIGMMPRRN